MLENLLVPHCSLLVARQGLAGLGQGTSPPSLGTVPATAIPCSFGCAETKGGGFGGPSSAAFAPQSCPPSLEVAAVALLGAAHISGSHPCPRPARWRQAVLGFLCDGGQSPGTGRRPQQLLSPVAGARTVRARPAAALSTAEGRRGVVRLCLRGTGSHSGGLSAAGAPGSGRRGPAGDGCVEAPLRPLGREPHAEPWGAELWGWAGLGARPPLRRPHVPGVAAARLTPCPSVLPLPSLFLSRR